MIEKKLFIPFITLLSAITFVLLTTNFSTTPASTSQTLGEMSLKYTGVVCVGINEPAELGECRKNLFVRLGQNYTRGALTGSYGANFDINAIGVANNTVAQGADDTSVQGEWTTCGLARAAGIIRNVTAGCAVSTCPGNWTVTNEFTSSCDSVTVNATGLYEATTGSTLFAENTFTTATLNTNDKINVTRFVWVT